MSRILLAAACAVALACEPASKQDETRTGMQVLHRAVAAVRGVDTVEYDFVFGHPADPMGWVTGHTRTKRISDANDGWIRVSAHIRAQPELGRAEHRFDYGLDAERARLADLTERTYAESARGAGANVLATNAVYGYLSEFVEAEPFWKELGSANQVLLEEPEVVGGILCDVVRTTYDVEGRAVEVIWSIARSDHLPRRGRWVNSSYAPGTMTFTMTDLKAGHDLTSSDFVPPRPATLATAPQAPSVVGLGERVPDWELSTTTGQRIGSSSLLGRIVVLDFWNTWCFICRTIAPETRALAREVGGEDVAFVGVNVFETDDAAEYWKHSGATYPSVLAGESLARMLDVSGQPAVVVIDAEGRLRYVEVGATAHRTRHIRQAIEASRDPVTPKSGPGGLPPGTTR